MCVIDHTMSRASEIKLRAVATMPIRRRYESICHSNSERSSRSLGNCRGKRIRFRCPRDALVLLAGAGVENLKPLLEGGAGAVLSA